MFSAFDKILGIFSKWVRKLKKPVQEELYNVMILYYRPASLYIFHRRMITSISDSLSVQKSSEYHRC